MKKMTLAGAKTRWMATFWDPKMTAGTAVFSWFCAAPSPRQFTAFLEKLDLLYGLHGAFEEIHVQFLAKK